MADVFHSGIVLDCVSYKRKGTKLGMYSQSTRGPELIFLQVVIFCFVFYIRYFSKTMGKILNNVLRLICRSHAKNEGN